MHYSDLNFSQAIYTGELRIEPFHPECLQPASYDIHLGKSFKRYIPGLKDVIIDPLEDQSHLFEDVPLESNGSILLMPMTFVLGSTLEWFSIPNNLVCRLEGKSSIARLGLIVHTTAGFVDPRFCGELTTEHMNLAPYPMRLWPGMAIGQISLSLMLSDPSAGYGEGSFNSHYQSQVGATVGRPLASRLVVG